MTRSHSPNNSGGNAAIYVLIVVALFAALGFVLMRQSDTSESNRLSTERRSLIVNQMLAYPYQAKQAIDMMTSVGMTDASDIDFTRPDATGFESASDTALSYTRKVYHPTGGGLIPARIPPEAVSDSSYSNPAAGWYLGRPTSLEWSNSTEADVILSAFPLTLEICQAINDKLSPGLSPNPPVISGPTFQNAFIPEEDAAGNNIHGGSNIAEFDTGMCGACEGKPSLCVGDGTRYGFYSLIVNQ